MRWIPRPCGAALVSLAIGLAAPGAVTAQGAAAAEPVLRGSQVTTDSLIDALAIEGPAGSGATRGFRPARPGEAPKPAGPGRASLLVTFVTGSSALTAESRGILDTLAKAMQSDALAGLSFRIEGHADARGSAELNQALSRDRADAVARYLVDRHGVLRDRLRPEGRGSSEPMNRERVDAPENRRVTIVSLLR